jgi:hypothetical protein
MIAYVPHKNRSSNSVHSFRLRYAGKILCNGICLQLHLKDHSVVRELWLYAILLIFRIALMSTLVEGGAS